MILKLQEGYEKPQKTNATMCFPSAFVFHCFGRGSPQKIASKMLLFLLKSIWFFFTEEKLPNPKDLTPYIQVKIPFWLTNCWRLRFSLLSVGAGTSAAKPETCLSLYFMPSLPHSCTAARLWSSLAAIRSLCMPGRNASATQKRIWSVRYLHLDAHSMGNATERPSTKPILDLGDENICANHVEKNIWQVCYFQAVKWLLT